METVAFQVSGGGERITHYLMVAQIMRLRKNKETLTPQNIYQIIFRLIKYLKIKQNYIRIRKPVFYNLIIETAFLNMTLCSERKK